MPCGRHTAEHGAGFVGNGEHHTIADRDRYPAQIGFLQLLGAGIDSIEVRVKGVATHSIIGSPAS